MKQVSTRQLCLILVVSAFSLKLLFLPALLTELCGNVAYVVLLLTMLLDVGVLTIFLYIQRLQPDKNIKDIMRILFGTVVSKIIFVLYAVLFIIKSVALFQSLYIYFLSTLYKELDTYVYAISMLCTLFYILTLKLRTRARLIEASFAFVVISLLVTFAVGGIKTDFTNILLPFEMEGVNFFNGYKVLMWFGDYIILLFLMGEIKVDKGYIKKIYIYLTIAIVLTAFTYIIFYCLYGNTSIAYTNTVTDVVQILPPTADIGRVGWIVVLVWAYGLFMELMLLMTSGALSIQSIVETPHNVLGNSIMVIMCFISIFVTRFDMTLVIQIVLDCLTYFAIGMQYLVPLLMLVFSYRLRR